MTVLGHGWCSPTLGDLPRITPIDWSKGGHIQISENE